LICLISRPLLITLRHDWHRSKGLLKGFKLALRPWESLKNWWRYGQMKFVTDLKYQMVRRRTKKLTERFVDPYKIKKIVLLNTVELELPSTVKIHPVVNVSKI